MSNKVKYICNSCPTPCKLITKKGHSEPVICPMGVGMRYNPAKWIKQTTNDGV